MSLCKSGMNGRTESAAKTFPGIEAGSHVLAQGEALGSGAKKD
jgi:hypothetical protein